jgi:hypothetical protein
MSVTLSVARRSTVAHLIAAFSAIAVILAGGKFLNAGTFVLPGTTSDQVKLDLGFFSGGTSIDIQMTGTVNLSGDNPNGPFAPWVTNPDGSVVGHVDGLFDQYEYANPGAANYPTTFGGDGINHFAGGGANYAGGVFGFTGALTTDTTNPGTIRLGDVVGTFTTTPGRSDWFQIGLSDTVLTPSSGAHLYVAVVDTFYPNNIGSYDGTFSAFATPAPSSLTMLAGLGAVGAAIAVSRRMKRCACATKGDRSEWHLKRRK